MKLRRIVSMALVSIMLLTLLAACKTDTASPTPQPADNTVNAPNAEATNTPAAKAEPVTLTMLNRVNAEVVFDNNPMLDLLEELSGVRLMVDAPPISNYVDRLQIVMASGDLPDIVYTWSFDSKYDMWAGDDLIWNIEELAKDYPNLMHNITSPMWEMARTATTGGIHAVPRTTPEARWGVLVNQDWIDKLGTTMPTTPDELYEYGKLVKTQDPDGNGKDDTFLLSPYHLWTDIWLVTAFLPFSDKGVPDYDGEYKLRQKMDGYFPYLEFMHKLYEEGIMDPEFFTNKYYDDRTKFHQKRIALVHNGAGSVTGSITDEPQAMELYRFYPPLLAEGQIMRINEAAPSTWGGWMINKDLDEQKVHRILEFLDWGNSKEGFLTMQLGKQGVHYDSYDADSRYVAKTEEQIAVSRSNISGYASIANAYEGLSASAGDTLDKVAFNNQELDDYFAITKTVNFPLISVPTFDSWPSDNPDLVTKLKETEIKYVVGDITLEDLKAFLDNEYFPSIAEAEVALIEAYKAYDAANK